MANGGTHYKMFKSRDRAVWSVTITCDLYYERLDFEWRRNRVLIYLEKYIGKIFALEIKNRFNVVLNDTSL